MDNKWRLARDKYVDISASLLAGMFRTGNKLRYEVIDGLNGDETITCVHLTHDGRVRLFFDRPVKSNQITVRRLDTEPKEDHE